MQRHVPVILALFVSVILGIVGFRLARPWLSERKLRSTSDASSTEEVRIAGDNYLGYFFINSPFMRRQAPRAGLRINWTDDGGNSEERLRLFADGKYDIIVLPVNSYLEHGVGKDSRGRDFKWPGVSPIAISESRDADGIVAFTDRVKVGKVNDLNDPSLRIAYVPGSPSEFLLDLTITGFGLDRLAADSTWRVPVESPEKLLEMAKAGGADVFVTWEPVLSEILKIPGTEQVWGSGKFRGYIIDHFVVRRDFLADHEDQVLKFFSTYFRVMGMYANNRSQLLEDMSKSLNVDEKTVEGMLGKLEWYDLRENAELMFGITPEGSTAPSAEGLINSIIECTNVLASVGKLSGEALTGVQADPYLLTNRSILEQLLKSTPASVVAGASSEGEAVEFESMDDAAWASLREVGTMRVEPIIFQMGNDALDFAGKLALDKIGPMLTNNYPTYRVVVRGHTGKGSNEQANIDRSLRRGQTVAKYLETVHAIDSDRMRAEGLGSSQPPKQKPGEGRRAYELRLARVEFVLVEPNPF